MNSVLSSRFALRSLALVLASDLLSPPLLQAASLDFETYLSQVRTQNAGIQGSQQVVQGASDRASEGELVTTPFLIGSLGRSWDKSPKANPLASGSRTIADSWTLGVSKLWSFGLQSQVSYQVIHAELSGTSSAFVPMPVFTEAKPVVELSLPLWQNLFGRSTRAQARGIEMAAKATSAAEDFALRQKLSQAELAYWKLLFAREVLVIQKESYERSQRQRDLASRRVNLRLADESDLLQSESALKLRSLEWELAKNEERSARLSLNSWRGIDGDQVPEQFPPLVKEVTRITVPTHLRPRADARALEAQTQAAIASSEQAIERGKPSLELYSSLSWNGRRDRFGEASQDSWGSSYPNHMVGIRLKAPLDLSAISEAQGGYAREILGNQAKLERKLFEDRSDWEELNRKVNEARGRLELVRALEAAQKVKYSNERDRQSRGKSTAFLVLSFEQDLANAQLSRVRAELELATLLSQLRTYE
jgi:outer membrane protein TolC